jgi:predicted AAA+ superfamily ATPase
MLIDPENAIMQSHHLYPFSFEEFLLTMDDPATLEAFREVPVPYYAYEKLLNYFHLYALIGGMPEITGEYAAHRHLAGLRTIYGKIEDKFIEYIAEVAAGTKSRDLAVEVFQNTYPFAATRISFSRFGNLEKGSREISQAFKALGRAFLLQMVYPVALTTLPLTPDKLKFPRLQLLDTGLVNYFSGIQKPLFQSHDMNAIFEGQIARQVVGQEILATENPADGHDAHLNFWVRNKAQSTAEVDFVIQYNDLLIPVVVKSGEPGRLRSLHQFMDTAPHAYAVRLYAGKLAVQQTQTIRGKKFYLLNLPYFLAGKIREHLKGFIRLANE